jgi:hypothetical protein
MSSLLPPSCLSLPSKVSVDISSLSTHELRTLNDKLLSGIDASIENIFQCSKASSISPKDNALDQRLFEAAEKSKAASTALLREVKSEIEARSEADTIADDISPKRKHHRVTFFESPQLRATKRATRDDDCWIPEEDIVQFSCTDTSIPASSAPSALSASSASSSSLPFSETPGTISVKQEVMELVLAKKRKQPLR